MKLIKPSKTLDWSIILIVNFMWATEVPVIRLIGDRLDSTTIAYLPVILSTILISPMLLLENKKRSVKFMWRWKDIKHFVLPGLIGVFVMKYAFTIGSKLTLAANAGIITLTIPLLVAIFASVMLKEKMNSLRVVGFLVAITGVLITSVSDISAIDFKNSQYLAGNLIFLFACSCCAFYNTYCKILVIKGYTPWEILFYCSLVAGIASIPIVIWVKPFHFSVFISASPLAMLGILEISIIVNGIALILFFNVLNRMDVTQATLGNYLLPFFIAVLGVILLNESITLNMLLGGFLVLISTLLVTVFEKDYLVYLEMRKRKRSDKKTRFMIPLIREEKNGKE